MPGNRGQLEQLVYNLLTNALKFRWEVVAPQIRVSCRKVAATELPPNVSVPVSESDAFCEISVSDNRIGFEEKYPDRIFQIFRRLHSRNQFGGVGVVLAICKKITSTTAVA